MTASVVPGRSWKEMLMIPDERAGLLYERAVFGGDVGALATEAADVARVSGATASRARSRRREPGCRYLFTPRERAESRRFTSCPRGVSCPYTDHGISGERGELCA
jgi:hypothetical protein